MFLGWLNLATEISFISNLSLSIQNYMMVGILYISVCLQLAANNAKHENQPYNDMRSVMIPLNPMK